MHFLHNVSLPICFNIASDTLLVMDVLMKGLLKLFVLTKAREPVSGSVITDSVSRLTAGEWRPSPGSIYPLLSTLHSRGFLAKRQGGKVVFYSITKKGLLELEREKKRLLSSSERMMRVCMPLVMLVVHGLTESEVEDFRKDNEGFLAFRKQLFSMPKGKRILLMKAMSEQCKRLMK